MKLSFEKSHPGHRCSILPLCDVPIRNIPQSIARTIPLHLPQMAEGEISRHYTQLATETRGVNDGFYPLGSCTMKYNPKVNEELAALKEFTDIHPLQPEHTVQGCLEVMHIAERYLNEITGMDAMTFQPAAGAHGELTGVLLIKAYHQGRGDRKRTKIIVPDTAHGTNPATASMAGLTVVTVPSNEEGCVDLEKLRAAVGEDTAGLMITNPNTIGIFDKHIVEITKIIHDAGGLNYYDGANLNAIMGIVRPGDMGFDVIHLNLHKTFSTPHGGGGPGAGAVGCKELLVSYLPNYHVKQGERGLTFTHPEQSIGSVKGFYGNFLVVVRAMAYLITLGAEGIPEGAKHAVLNANYLKSCIDDLYDVPFDGICMHEFVLSLSKLKKEKGVTAMDVAKMLLDYGIHPPTMYFPLIIDEALMIEPTETESKETLDQAAEIFRKIHEIAQNNPEFCHQAPVATVIGRPNEVDAARNPKLRYHFKSEE